MNSWVAAGATAAVMSERGRHLLRRGAVYALAGAITVGDALSEAAKGVAHEAEHVASTAGDLASDLLSEARRSEQGSTSTASGERPAHAKPRRAPRSPAGA
jgi:hypothetical protein